MRTRRKKRYSGSRAHDLCALGFLRLKGVLLVLGFGEWLVRVEASWVVWSGFEHLLIPVV